MIQNDTICALATATGGALGIIRISGPQALHAASSVCSDDIAAKPANTVHYTHIAADGTTIDEAMVSIFRAPHSYTGEDSVEISCHGSRYILNKVLELLIQNGCRMAEPGEYTMRAYLNGKLDLSQAEAVADLIASTNRATHQLAMSQLKGHFSSELAQLRQQLLKLTSLLELELDFSDHEELEFADRTELTALAQRIEAHIDRLARSFEKGQALRQGIPVAIIGKTNVGKSTLLNKLLKDERSIVSNIHGTTRDTIEDTIDLHGTTFRFIDTAGIRQTTDEVEQIGISRTYAALNRARIALWLIDAEPTADEQQEILNRCKDKQLIIVINKIDTGTNITDNALHTLRSSHLTPHPPFIRISAKTGQGIHDLEQAIYQAADIPEITENDVIVTSARHYTALVNAQASLRRVLDGMLQQFSADLLAEDLRQATHHLASITGGEITTPEVLTNIFSHFCVGK